MDWGVVAYLTLGALGAIVVFRSLLQAHADLWNSFGGQDNVLYWVDVASIVKRHDRIAHKSTPPAVGYPYLTFRAPPASGAEGAIFVQELQTATWFADPAEAHKAMERRFGGHFGALAVYAIQLE